MLVRRRRIIEKKCFDARVVGKYNLLEEVFLN
jgi:hypothetical protein